VRPGLDPRFGHPAETRVEAGSCALVFLRQSLITGVEASGRGTRPGRSPRFLSHTLPRPMSRPGSAYLGCCADEELRAWPPDHPEGPPPTDDSRRGAPGNATDRGSSPTRGRFASTLGPPGCRQPARERSPQHGRPPGTYVGKQPQAAADDLGLCPPLDTRVEQWAHDNLCAHSACGVLRSDGDRGADARSACGGGAERWAESVRLGTWWHPARRGRSGSRYLRNPRLLPSRAVRASM